MAAVSAQPMVISRSGPGVRVEGGFRGVDQLQDLLRPLFQIDAFLRQRDPALPADKQLPASWVSRSIICLDSVDWVKNRDCAAFVIFSSLATARK